MLNNCIDVLKSEEFNSLDNINRFNKTRVLKHETVSQHTYWVTLFIAFIMAELTCLGVKECDDPNTKNEALLAGMFHDFDESISGDTLFDTKHNDFNGKDIKKSICAYIDHRMKKFYTNTPVCNVLNKAMKSTENNELIRFIVKLSDWLACLKYEYSELQLGNIHFEAIMHKSQVQVNTLVHEFSTYFSNKYTKNVDRLVLEDVVLYLSTYRDIYVKLKNQDN